jgi:biopolymer transport protein ExbD
MSHGRTAENEGILFLQISNEGSLRINAETVSREKFGERLRDLYRVRVERVLFVTADSNVRFQGVVRIIDEARGSITNLYVTLLTPAGLKEPACL